MTKVPLQSLQRQFSRALIYPGKPTSAQKLRARPGPPIPFSTRLEIYRYAYYARIIDCVSEDFPSLLKHLGRARFRRLVRRYLVKHPSQYATIAEVGREFPDFLTRGSYRRLPSLAEYANYDWKRYTAFFEDSPDPLSREHLGELAQGKRHIVRIGLTPSASLQKFKHILSGTPKKPAWVCTFKGHVGVRSARLSQRQFDFLMTIRTPISSEIFAERVASLGISPNLIQKWFKTWTELGMLYIETTERSG